MTFATVVTDASFFADTGKAGWACWIVCNGERYKAYGAFSGKKTCSTHAEVCAIGNGIFLAIKRFNPEKIHVVTDSMNAIHILESFGKKGLSKKNKTNATAQKEAAKIIKKISTNLTLTFKHVRAHTDIQDKRSFVNRWCDEHAKKAAKQITTTQE
jgi:ribonuclease HI